MPGFNATVELLDGFSEYPCPGVARRCNDGNGFCCVVVGVDGSRQRKWGVKDILAESRVVCGTSFSLLVKGWDVQLSYTVLQPVQFSSDTACFIEHEEIRCFPCQFYDQSAGTFLGGQCKLNDPVSLNLFDLVDSCPCRWARRN